MSLRMLGALCATALLSSIAASCGGPSEPPYDRAKLIDEVANEVILPGYEAVATDTQALSDAASALCADPTPTTLAAAQDAWRTAYLDWERTLAYRFGPALTDSYAAELAYEPTSPSAIETVIGGTDPIDEPLIQSLGGASRGLYALEYLLFGDTSANTVTALMDVRRCAFVDTLASDAALTAEALADAWRPSGGDYVGTLTTAGQVGNATYPAELSAISALLTELLNALEVMKDDKLGAPLGLTMTSATPDPQLVESPYAHVSLEALQANLEGIAAVWNGTTFNFDAYVRTRNPALADEVLRQLAAAKAALSALPSPLSDYVAGADLTDGSTAFTALADLLRTLSTDVSTTLAVSLMFSSTDGD